MNERRPRVLVVAQRLPRPVRGGVDLRVEQTIGALAEIGEVGVVGITPSVHGAGPPGGVRLWRAVEPTLGDNRDEAAASIAWLRTPGGHPSDRWWTPSAATVVAEAISDFAPDAVVLEHLWMRRALDVARAAGCPAVLDEHNVEALLHEELVDLSGHDGPPKGLARRLAVRTAEIEAATIRSVDQIWAASDEDALELRARYQPAASVHMIPNSVDVDPAPISDRGIRPPVLLFPAAFGYPPNMAAALWLLREVLPLVRDRLAEATLVLAGHAPPASLQRLARGVPGVTITGTVPDMAPYFAAATVLPVPLVVGGGTRIKVLEAFAAGIPVVSTRKGVEGIVAQPDRDFLPAGTGAQFADAIVRLALDPELARSIATNARTLVAERYSRRATTGLIRAALSELGLSIQVPQ